MKEITEAQSETLKLRPSTARKLRLLKAQFFTPKDNHSDVQEEMMKCWNKHFKLNEK